ncbi:DUF2281 domain-containing protein [candidate division KSB1 bacterium]|nr:DUF2281 domain-containing protein [candidate division KSB1 bacterium]
MSVTERINLHVQQLPQPLQIEVLHFVEFLAAKLQAQAAREDELLWSQFSLAQALRGMEDEDGPVYDDVDFKQKWR